MLTYASINEGVDVNDPPDMVSYVHPGFHETITVEAHTRFAAGVRCHTLRVSGVLDAGAISSEYLNLDNGIVHGSRDCHIRHITGQGTIEINGDLICDSIDMTGSLRCRDNIRCSGGIVINGLLVGKRHVEAESITLTGTLVSGDVNGRTLTIRTLHSAMFDRFGMDGYGERSQTGTVTVADLDAGRLDCKLLNADTAVLREGSFVEHAVCTTELSLDTSSAVVLLNGGCHRARHLKSA